MDDLWPIVWRVLRHYLSFIGAPRSGSGHDYRRLASCIEIRGRGLQGLPYPLLAVPRLLRLMRLDTDVVVKCSVGLSGRHQWECNIMAHRRRWRRPW